MSTSWCPPGMVPGLTSVVGAARGSALEHPLLISCEPVTVPDLAADFFATPLAHEPGTWFSYTGTGPYVAARALRAATGASVRDYLLPRVFGPLAIHNPQWHTCPLGHPVGLAEDPASLAVLVWEQDITGIPPIWRMRVSGGGKRSLLLLRRNRYRMWLTRVTWAFPIPLD